MAGWDWNQLKGVADAAKNILTAYVTSNPQAAEMYYQDEAAKRQKNLDAWNQMYQNEQLKAIQRQNATIQLDNAAAEPFRGTSMEPFIWKPGGEKTQSTSDYLTSVGVANPGGTNLTGTVTTQLPETLRQTEMNQGDYLNLLNAANQEKQNQAASDFKMWVEQQKLNGKDELTPYQKEQLRLEDERNNISWFNATKDQDQTKKDPLLLGYKDLSTIASKKDKYGNPDNTQKDSLSSRYSSAIRENINDPKKVQEYIDRYNLLNGTGYTYQNWLAQSQKTYNPANNRPINNLVNNKTISNQRQTVQNKISPTSTPVKTVQLKNKKTGKMTTAYVGIKDGQYYGTENEARLN